VERKLRQKGQFPEGKRNTFAENLFVQEGEPTLSLFVCETPEFVVVLCSEVFSAVNGLGSILGDACLAHLHAHKVGKDDLLRNFKVESRVEHDLIIHDVVHGAKLFQSKLDFSLEGDILTSRWSKLKSGSHKF